MPDGEPRLAPAWDPVFTVTLLVLGLINTTQEVAQARALPALIEQVYVMQGIGRYTNVGAAASAGLALQAISVLCLVLAIGFAVPRIRRHRTAFWIPVVCAVVSLIVSLVVVLAVTVTDPAFAAFVARTT